MYPIDLRSPCSDAPSTWQPPNVKFNPGEPWSKVVILAPSLTRARKVGNYPGVRMPFFAFARRDYTEQITTELYYLCRASYFYDFSKRQKE